METYSTFHQFTEEISANIKNSELMIIRYLIKPTMYSNKICVSNNYNKGKTNFIMFKFSSIKALNYFKDYIEKFEHATLSLSDHIIISKGSSYLRVEIKNFNYNVLKD